MLFVSTCPVPVRPLPATDFYFSSPGSAGSPDSPDSPGSVGSPGSPGSLGASLTLVGCAESPAWEYCGNPAGGITSAEERVNVKTQADDLVRQRGNIFLAAAGRAWEQLAAQAQVDDRVQRRGTGLVAFVSFGFDAAPPVFAVPRWVFGADAAGAWLTVAYRAEAPRPDLVEFMRCQAETWRVNSGMRLVNPTNPSEVEPCTRIPVGAPKNPGRERFEANVRAAVAAIRAGAARKIVCARRVDFPLVKPAPVAETCARLVALLSRKYPDCWVFSVGGLTGATPEMLLEARGEAPNSEAAGVAAGKRVAHARVLAGTARPGEGVNLMESAKNRREHELAVASVVAPLEALLSGSSADVVTNGCANPVVVSPGFQQPEARAFTPGENFPNGGKSGVRLDYKNKARPFFPPLETETRPAPHEPVGAPREPGRVPHEPEQSAPVPGRTPHEPGREPSAVQTRGPYRLELPNLVHLATDVTAPIPPGKTVFDLLGVIHPTAAVAGLPREVALGFIRRQELDRGRYAGPVGWVDARGGGQFALALRCAQVSERAVSAQVGAGIMADSDPQGEFLETEAKLAPIRDCLDFDADCFE
ncbi:chorismate-binding protein [Mobiluncus mulieris]|uniref:chorismate-binding protein n=1 Tax=Mobiluncus mulieris TaxID=2052 RepID=UPI00147008C6|nr:chorismate-binding protein [Mobiluncus mulieris]